MIAIHASHCIDITCLLMLFMSWHGKLNTIKNNPNKTQSKQNS